MEPAFCMVCDKPARERECGGYDDFCSDECELEQMLKIADRRAEEKTQKDKQTPGAC